MSKDKSKKTTIGGQALIEGVMMQSQTSVALAVRDEDGIIRKESYRKKPLQKSSGILRFPFIRGIVAFIDSFTSGSKHLLRSGEVFGEGEPTKFEKWLKDKLRINPATFVSIVSVLISLFLVVGLFIVCPQLIRKAILGENGNPWAVNFIEGGFKLLIFILYLFLFSLVSSVKRTFMYHGAEHKTISCYEKGLELTPENAKKCSRLHDRCGTTFIFIVMLISILVFACFEALCGEYVNNATSVKVVNGIIRVVCKIAFLPLVAGISYEILRLLSKTDCFIFFPLKAPGLALQLITTKEPTLDMLEVAITAFKEVMDLDADNNKQTSCFVVSKKRREVTEEVIEKLKNNGIEEKAEAEWIVSISLGIKREEVYSENIITPKYIEKINNLVNERISGRPLWYCVGDTDFYGYLIKVDERVLIPRPETELLVENALQFTDKNSKVLDLCTGSGAIGIAINKKTGAKVTAIDVSLDALNLAKENAKSNDAKIDFILSDMFTNLNKDNKFDLIISNPPYVKTEEINTLQNEVKNYEPKLALDGGKDGLDFYRIIAENSKEYLTNNGILLLECGENQANEISELLKGFSKIEIIKDYEGIERIIKAVL